MREVKVHREPITSDIIFKAVFGSDTEESKASLIALLNDVLDTGDNPIVDLVYKNPFSLIEAAGEKYIVMDVKVELNSGERVDVEMQTGEYNVYINRTIFYGCKQLTKSIRDGESYDKLKPSIVISFVKDKIFSESKEIHNIFTLRNNMSGHQLSELLELHYIELGKIDWSDREVNKLSPLEQIGAYMLCSGNEDEKQFVEELIQNGRAVISMADNVLKKVSQDERLRNLRESREYAEMQHSWELQNAEERGIEIGGKEKQQEIAKRLKEMGISDADIVEGTGLSIEEVRKL